MINRILIRMKVVQMLYSYLLTRSDFNVLPAPDAPSRDKRYAYSLYCDLLLLLIDQSGFRITNYEGRPRIERAEKKAKNDFTRIAQSLASNATPSFGSHKGIFNLQGIFTQEDRSRDW